MTTTLTPRVLVRGPGLRPPHLAHGPLLWVVRAPEPGAPLDESVLDAAERRRAAALRRPAERALYVAAHSALRRVLSAYTGIAAPALRLIRQSCPRCGDLHGRPALAGPAGQGVHFSLSHSGGLALLGLASAPVGVDVQRVPDPRLAAEASRALHPSERAQLENLPPKARVAAFARCWTRKEAFLKATGDGLSLRALHELYVGTGPRPAGPTGWAFADVEMPMGWTAACVAGLSVPATPPVRPPVRCASRGSRVRR
ncbi:4'-phosphopantetheinyl transferase superfamily protein [Streptomyces cinnabarinus]|uniref:4'-phosphopantetheinyl transferase superfamily protein n=1 Tax=Streptomyces cinnabarinus TaxID=67287 RepID=A0ABY7K485_9ACTN|nr:4'-phosphopantetheinyl transferase superfamily protein [Streptomyces cinnabarinus]WAZ19306.1 4'-phosphopantetheinyl transferase superfamily protein [Streptomyces cinnabarinus]